MWSRWDSGHRFSTVPLGRTVSPWDRLDFFPWPLFVGRGASTSSSVSLFASCRSLLAHWADVSAGVFSSRTSLCLRPFLCFSQRDILSHFWLKDYAVFLNNAIRGPCNELATHSGVHCLHLCAPGEGSRIKGKLQVQFYEISIIFWATRMCVATDCDAVAHAPCTWGSPHLWCTCSFMKTPPMSREEELSDAFWGPKEAFSCTTSGSSHVLPLQDVCVPALPS